MVLLIFRNCQHIHRLREYWVLNNSKTNSTHLYIQGKTTDALSKLMSLQPSTAVLVQMDGNGRIKR